MESAKVTDVEMAVVYEEREEDRLVPPGTNKIVETLVEKELMEHGYLPDEAPKEFVQETRQKHTLHQRLMNEFGMTREEADAALKKRNERIAQDVRRNQDWWCGVVCMGVFVAIGLICVVLILIKKLYG